MSDQDASPLDLALRANQIEIVDILTRFGAKESRAVQELPKSTDGTDGMDVMPGDVDIESGNLSISLTFDKPIQQGLLVGQFIYPSTLMETRGFIYQLSQPLETMSASLSLRVAQRRADMVEYPLSPEDYDSKDILYDICRSTVDFQQLELREGSQSSSPGIVSMHRDWTGGWKVRRNHDGEGEYLFRTTPDWSRMKEEGCRWMTEDGELLGRTGVEGVTPTLCFERGLQKERQDILVSCFVGKLWSETICQTAKEEDKN